MVFVLIYQFLQYFQLNMEKTFEKPLKSDWLIVIPEQFVENSGRIISDSFFDEIRATVLIHFGLPKFDPILSLAQGINQRLRILGWAFREGKIREVQQIFFVSEFDKFVAIEFNDYLQRMKKIQIPPSFKNFIRGCEARRQCLLSNFPICPRLKFFGRCPEFSGIRPEFSGTCAEFSGIRPGFTGIRPDFAGICPEYLPFCSSGAVRHFFTEKDRPPDGFPIEGEIICEIDEIIDATAFRSRIFERIFSRNEREKFDPPLEAEIILAGFVPLDFDPNWTPDVLKFVEILVLKKKIRCRIRLTLGTTIWTENLIVLVSKANGEYLETIHSLHEDLQQQQLAARNPDHINALIQLCSINPQLKVIYVRKK